MSFKPFFLEQNDNTLLFNPADNDGFIVSETENPKSGIYIYYSEIDTFIGGLNKVKKEKEVH